MNVEEIKQKAEIAEIVERSGYKLTGRGRYLTVVGHDSLVLDTFKNYYSWNSTGESGSVIDWVMNREGLDFKDGVRRVCEISGLPAPDWSQVNVARYAAAKVKMDAWTVAAGVLSLWLQRSVPAMAYAHARGWSDGTVKAETLGFTGWVDWNAATAWDDYEKLAKEMRDTLLLAGVDLKHPAAIALLGKKFGSAAEMQAWQDEYQIDPVEFDSRWLESKRVPGLLGRGMLVYPHFERGKVVYFSCRSVPEYAEKAHYNIPVALGGQKQRFYNHEWTPRAEVCIVVEGQACAISLGQLGFAAVALAGLNADADLGDLFKHHKKLYVALDADKAGKTGLNAICEAIHPLVGVIQLPKNVRAGEELIEIKDFNDLHQAMIKAGYDEQTQASQVSGLLVNSISYLEIRAAEAGATQDRTDRDTLTLQTLQQYVKLDATQRDLYRDRIAQALKTKIRAFDRLVKRLEGNQEDDKDKPGEYVSCWGGTFEGWKMEYVYDPESKTASWAYRDPDGKLGTAAYLDLWRGGEKVRYVPAEPYEFVHSGQIRFPSRLPEKTKDVKELLAIINAFLRRYYFFTDERYAQLISYWVLGSWFYDACEAYCYLRALGPAGCGKTELMKRVTQLCYHPIRSSGVDTTAVLFRTIEMFEGGTLHISEYDQENSDTENSFIKILLDGSMRGGSVNRLVKYTDENGTERMRPEGFRTYCPKALDGRKETKDDALATRCITIWTYPVNQEVLKTANIPLFVDDKFRAAALTIQNELLRYRLENWQDNFPIDNDLDVDIRVSPRMNQVVAPLRTIVRMTGDEIALENLNSLLREIHDQERNSQVVTSITARVVEGLWKILITPMMFKEGIEINEEGLMLVKTGYVAMVTNDLIDKMNEVDEEDEENKYKTKKGLTARGVGSILKSQLSMTSIRKSTGFHYVINLPALVGQMTTYLVPWQEDLAMMLGTIRKTDIPKPMLKLAEEYEIEPVIPAGYQRQDGIL